MQVAAARIPIVAVCLLLAAIGCGEQETQATAGGAQPLSIESGMLRGIDAGRAEQFLGIPYAAPPLGDLRWKPPAPVPPWPDVRNATVLPVAYSGHSGSSI